MGAPAVNIPAKPAINQAVDRPRLAQVDGGCDILRLDVESRRVGNSHLPTEADAVVAERKRGQKMHHIGPLERLPQQGVVGLCKGHPLRGNQAVEHRDILLFHQIFGIARLAGADNPHGMSVRAQRFTKPASRNGHSVIGRKKLIGHKQNFHFSPIPFPTFHPRFALPIIPPNLRPVNRGKGRFCPLFHPGISAKKSSRRNRRAASPTPGGRYSRYNLYNRVHLDKAAPGRICGFGRFVF